LAGRENGLRLRCGWQRRHVETYTVSVLGGLQLPPPHPPSTGLLNPISSPDLDQLVVVAGHSPIGK